MDGYILEQCRELLKVAPVSEIVQALEILESQATKEPNSPYNAMHTRNWVALHEVHNLLDAPDPDSDSVFSRA